MNTKVFTTPVGDKFTITEYEDAFIVRASDGKRFNLSPFAAVAFMKAYTPSQLTTEQVIEALK